MAMISKCPKCGGKRFVYDIGGSVPMKKHLKGTTFFGSNSDSCNCEK